MLEKEEKLITNLALPAADENLNKSNISFGDRGSPGHQRRVSILRKSFYKKRPSDQGSQSPRPGSVKGTRIIQLATNTNSPANEDIINVKGTATGGGLATPDYTPTQILLSMTRTNVPTRA